MYGCEALAPSWADDPAKGYEAMVYIKASVFCSAGADYTRNKSFFVQGEVEGGREESKKAKSVQSRPFNSSSQQHDRVQAKRPN